LWTAAGEQDAWDGDTFFESKLKNSNKIRSWFADWRFYLL